MNYLTVETFYKRNKDKIEVVIDEGGNLVDNSDENRDQSSFKVNLSNKIKLFLPSKVAQGLMVLLNNNQSYRKLFHHNWKLKTGYKSNFLLQLKMLDTCDSLDFSGNKIASILLWEYIELEDALHWLSTLGGAFSNLGEHDQHFAKKAGENAQKQLIVAQKFGDKLVIAKCLLFVAMSLMQQQVFNKAAAIIRHVFSFCQTPTMKDLAGTGKIISMCRGIWARLKYEFSQSRKSKGIQSTNEDNSEIEVEFKFLPNKDFLEKMNEIGAQNIGTKHINDVYLDTKNFELLRKDHWLRYRNGKVELKSPLINNEHDACNTVYKECTSYNEIEIILNKKIPETIDNLYEDWIVLASVETTRQMWKLEDFNIVLDSLPDGFQIAEIELTSKTKSGIESASQRLDELSNQLGLKKQKEGKVDHCLQYQNPQAYQVLHSRNIDIKRES